MKYRVVKSTLYTDEVDGHQHEVCVCDDGSLYVCYATSAGADNSHSHGIVFEGGTLTILADSGHSHVLAEGQPGVAVVPADAIVVVAASASPTRTSPRAQTAANKSTRQPAARDNDSMKIVILSEAQHAHYSKLGASEQEAFINKSATERDADIAKALEADPVVFKGEKTGLEVRKGQGEFALKLAKQAEENAVTMAKQADEIAKRDAEIKKQRIRSLSESTFAKKAPGDDETHDFIVEKLEGNDKAMAVIKGLVALSKLGQPAPGFNGGNDNPADDSPQGKLAALVTKHATEHKVDERTARLAVVKTAEGRALYNEIELAKKA